MDRGACWAIVWVMKNQTWLSDWKATTTTQSVVPGPAASTFGNMLEIHSLKPYPDLWNHKLWGRAGICVLTRFPGEPHWMNHKLKSRLPREGLPWWLSGKESACQCRRHKFDPWVGKIPWRRKWQPTPVFLSGKFHGQRSLVGYSPWSCKESYMTEQLNSNDWFCTLNSRTVRETTLLF